jgi:hypothetical protein
MSLVVVLLMLVPGHGQTWLPGPEAAAQTLAWPVSPDRHQPCPLEGIRCPAPERIRSLTSIPAGDLGRGVPEIPRDLLEWHPVVVVVRSSEMAT